MNKNYKNIINENLENYVNSLSKLSLPPIIIDSVKYSLLSKGKRIRALLLLETYKSFNNEGNLEEVIPFSCAIEMIHAYSLIHDDLPAIDNDNYRRGKLSNHKVFGEAIGILAGDALLNLAYEIIFDFSSKNNKLKYILAAKEISKAAGIKGMISGQVLDIISEGKNIDEKTLLYIHKNKTAKLIKSSMVSGAILSSIEEKYIDKIREIGYLIGIAFQIKNDLLDVKSTFETLGKYTNSDIKNNKITYVTMYGIDKSEKYLQEYIEKAVSILSTIDIDTKNLKNFILEIFM